MKRSKHNALRKSYGTFWDHVPRREFMEAISSRKDAKFARLNDALHDPAFLKYPFATLCRELDITLKDLHGILRDYNHHVALIRAEGHIPDIMEDIAVDARSSLGGCVQCQGTGKIPQENGDPIECFICGGEGKVRVKGDSDARKLLLETTGLIGKRGGPNVLVQTNIGDLDQMESVIKMKTKVFEEENVVTVDVKELKDGCDASET